MKIIKLLFYSLLILLIGRLAGGAGSSANTTERRLPISFYSSLPTEPENTEKAASAYGQSDSLAYTSLPYYSFNNKPGLTYPMQRPTLLQK
ncbi:hypothetical protein [Geofilum rhodophaeum]|uniref:hypothetical protein n=1 Tax=Geofilum rhodophaeum TaxID=1965019 RepID=UPI000B51EC47|nr:hypothetical protein [Geofilum rhodophaeum]